MHRDGEVMGIRGIREALAVLGLHYSHAWVQWACSKAFRGKPIPVSRRGWGPKGRIWILARDLMAWADEFKGAGR